MICAQSYTFETSTLYMICGRDSAYKPAVDYFIVITEVYVNFLASDIFVSTY